MYIITFIFDIIKEAFYNVYTDKDKDMDYAENIAYGLDEYLS